jgi:RNA polymerase sigma-70 factor (ECF subfamily)
MTVSPAAPGAVGRRAAAALPPGMRLSAATSAPQTLEQLLGRIAGDNDQAAFARLYAATKGKLFSTVLLIVRRRELAEDVIQEVYARIWLNAASYRSSAGSPMTWMITVARNLAIDSARKMSRESYADDAELLALPSDSPSAVETLEAAEAHSAAIEQRQQMLHALQALDPIRRDLVVAAYLHGESRAQLAKRAGVPVNTVKTWIRRAVLEVQEILRNS